MAANTTTFANRVNGFVKKIMGCNDAVYDTMAARQPATEERSKLFDGAVMGPEAVKAQAKEITGTLLRGMGLHDQEPVVAILGAPAGLIRKSADGQENQIKVNANVKNGKYLSEAQLLEQFPECIRGILTIGSTAGPAAELVKVDGVDTILRPVATEQGTPFKMMQIDIGGVAGKEAPMVEIEEAIAQTGLRWVATQGEEGKPAYSPVREILKGTVQTNYLSKIIDKDILTSADTLTYEAMRRTGTIPRESDNQRTVGELAQYLCMASGHPDALFPVGMCLASWVKSKEEGTSVDYASEHAGEAAIEAWTMALKSLTADQLQAFSEKKSAAGHTISSGRVLPNEAGAMIQSMITQIQHT